MSVKPIDLQTLFMQLGKVSQAQTAEKEGAILQKAVEGAVAQKKEIEAAHTVKKPELPETDAQKVRPRSGGSPGGQAESKGQKREGGSEEETGNREVIRDSDLGGHIDVSG